MGGRMMVAAAIFMVVAVSLAAGSPDRHQKWWKWPSSGSDGASSSSSSSPVYSRGGPSSIVLPLYGNVYPNGNGGNGRFLAPIEPRHRRRPHPRCTAGVGRLRLFCRCTATFIQTEMVEMAVFWLRWSLVIVVVPIPGVQPGWAVFDCSAAKWWKWPFSGSDRASSSSSSPSPVYSRGGPSSIVPPLYGNVYPNGFYFAQVDIGNPPRPYFVDPDTGSDLTWLQCDAPCVHCTRAPHPYYKPNNDLVICKDPLCASLHLGDYTCEDPQQCDYEVEYADGGSSLGVLLNDVFHLNLTNGVKINPHLALGCGYDQVPGTSHHPLDGILGLGRGKSSVVTQLWGQGLVRNVIGHCLSGRGGGYLFLGDEVVKELRGKPLREARDDPTLPFCWKGRKPFRSISDVKKYFKPFALSFANGWRSRTLFDISPESYLIISDKMVIYDNEKSAIGWTRANCDRPPAPNLVFI
nr:Aspartic peptidase [Ipomoea trifida]